MNVLQQTTHRLKAAADRLGRRMTPIFGAAVAMAILGVLAWVGLVAFGLLAVLLFVPLVLGRLSRRGQFQSA